MKVEVRTAERDYLHDKYYNFLSVSFTVILLASNISAIKIWNFFGYILDGGTAIFPLLYVIGDITTEVYGLSAARKIIRKALFINILFSLFLYFTTLLPSIDNIPSNQAYNNIFSFSPRIFIASVVSYYIGEILNANIICFLKAKFASKFFIIRAIISTSIGSCVESLIFCFISFYDILTYASIIQLALFHTIIKISYEIIVMPITARLVYFFKNKRSYLSE